MFFCGSMALPPTMTSADATPASPSARAHAAPTKRLTRDIFDLLTE
jgi:hypothetical protein